MTTVEPGYADPTSTSTFMPNSKTETNYNMRLATLADAAAVSHLIGSTWSEFFGYSVSPSDLEHYLATKLSVEGITADLKDPKDVFLVATTTPDATQPQSQSQSQPQPSSSSESECSSDSSTIVGVVQLVRDSTEACLTLPKPIELQRLYAHSSTHGSGLGRLLVEKAEAKGRELGYGSIWLGVWENNESAKRFYEKMGFESKGGEHFFFVGESKRRDLILEKRL
ncbi:hypothetical protein IAR55_005766 [Kwoniella newhampshirensis]|uniref:N-acetyltransferase domain-containing protein n=1 Tax=Kwoniella newhampshirensis TaxID=1651941 RepID=A0AAW0YV39_9TREE